MKDRFGHEVTVGDTVAYVTSKMDYSSGPYVTNRRRMNIARVIGTAPFAIQLEEVLIEGEKGDEQFSPVVTSSEGFVIVWGPEGAGAE
jgi:hypothetical protein